MIAVELLYDLFSLLSPPTHARIKGGKSFGGMSLGVCSSVLVEGRLGDGAHPGEPK